MGPIPIRKRHRRPNSSDTLQQNSASHRPTQSGGYGIPAQQSCKIKQYRPRRNAYRCQTANGDWEIVEAKNHIVGVVKSSLNTWKARPHYAGLRRLPSFKLLPPPKDPVKRPPAIKEGNSGKLVEQAQRAMEHYYPSAVKAAEKEFKTAFRITGQYGPMTVWIVKRIQRTKGLTPHGRINAAMWKQLGVKA